MTRTRGKEKTRKLEGIIKQLEKTIRHLEAEISRLNRQLDKKEEKKQEAASEGRCQKCKSKEVSILTMSVASKPRKYLICKECGSRQKYDEKTS